MKNFLAITILFGLAGIASAQVDTEHRRVLALQGEFPVVHGEEPIVPVATFWFNENNYPGPNMALRVIFAGVFADAELSWFLPSNPNIAVGAGLGGGLFVNSVIPYQNGSRLSEEQFYGDTAKARIFLNQTIPNSSPLPLNLRTTYAVAGNFYRDANNTAPTFTLPSNFLTQTLQAEVHLGGFEPGLLGRRGAELYVSATSNFRSGFDAFGPGTGLFPAHSEYGQLFGSLGGRIPAGPTIITARTSGGWGQNIDELSAWKLGGNLVNLEPLAYTLHGYYAREFFAADFGLVNLAWTVPLADAHNLAAHFYGDYAIVKTLDVTTGNLDGWHNLFGVGAGISARLVWSVDMLLSYGYGVNAVRDGEHGGHEVALALERKF